MQQATITGFRLSPQQRQVWRLQQEAPRLPYRVQGAIFIKGPLDLPRLQAALAAVLQRHEILRTTFHTLPGMDLPLQVISDSQSAWGPEEDLRGQDEPTQAARVTALWREMLEQPFDFV